MNSHNESEIEWRALMNRNEQIARHQIAVCEHSSEILDSAQAEFHALSSIFNKKDITFLVLAVLLHGAAKFGIRNMRMKSDKKLAEMNPLHSEEHSNRSNRLYYASREEIITNPVPFDATVLDPQYKRDRKLMRPKFKGTNHRFTALGHDPILGLIVGTANIMTSTITRNDFRSWHVNTEQHERLKRNGKEAIEMLDTICEPASTARIFQSVALRLNSEEGWLTLGIAFVKEIVHLLTDMPSLMSLPLPFVSAFSPAFAHQLSLYGLNTGTIVEGTITIKVINYLVAILHRFYMEEGCDENLYKVRTTKIITYANVVTCSGDLCVTLYQACCGDLKAMRKFDLGGYLCTLDILVKNPRVITEMECEYMRNKFWTEFEKGNFEK